MGHPSAFTRCVIPAIALTIGLAACTPTSTTPPVASPSPVPSFEASAPASATAGPSANPSQAPVSTAPTGAPSAAASVSEVTSPAPAGATGILRGSVYDEETDLVPDGTTVTVKSLDESLPYGGTTTTGGGNYVVNGVPLNTQLSISVTRPGWTTRTQIGVVRPYDPRIENPNVFNFGGRVTQADRRGISFFISSYPEIAHVTPTDDDRSQPNDKLRFTLTLSEPLDVENRRRLASAFTIVPNNEEAIEEDTGFPDVVATSTELEGLRLDDPEDPVYAYRQNSSFLNGAKVSSFAWDAAGLTATFTLDAPIKTDQEEEAEYAFVLVQRSEQAIVDGEKLPLGMNEEGGFGSTSTGDIIYNAIAEPSVNLNTGFDDAEERWADTHLTFTRFTVEEDTTAPTITDVVARRDYTDDSGTATDRIEITFSEPMIAYPRIAAPGTLSLNNYVLATAPTERELEERELEDGANANKIGAGSDADAVQDALEHDSSVVIDADKSQSGRFNVAISVRDPKIVIIDLPEGSLPLDAEFIKVLAGTDDDSNSVADPAGNNVMGTARDRVGPIY